MLSTLALVKTLISYETASIDLSLESRYFLYSHSIKSLKILNSESLIKTEEIIAFHNVKNLRETHMKPKESAYSYYLVDVCSYSIVTTRRAPT